jgi:hypothetical protein
MKGMHELGIISDTRMGEFDKMCLVKENGTAYTPETPQKKEYTAAPR